MFRYLSRGLGTHETKSPDWLSMVMFDRQYVGKLVKLGEIDAEKRSREIAKLLI
jgi:NTE family protein